MNKSQLIEKLAVKTKTTKLQSESIVDAFLDIVQNTVADGEEVKLVGFGIFTKTSRKSRNGRNPKTGDPVQIQACYVPRFRPGKEFKELIQPNEQHKEKKPLLKKKDH